ncbi:MAG TPA: YdcF family protein [Thermoanaerobaculia bacterium]|nr:YdcF family protein [Thermoanaerobaculia bacterium]
MFLSAGKALTDPLLIVLVVAIACIAIARRRARNDRALKIALIALIVLWLLSLHLVTFALARSLTISVVENGEPDVIVVAGGGSISELEVLTSSSASRVATAVAWWRQHPRAHVVMAGVDTTANGASAHTAELMREYAELHGVPASMITLETKSRNTREHAIQLLSLPGVSRATRVGIVTSSWHMRRARREFEKHFDHVIAHADDPPSLGTLVVNDFIPSSVALRDSTRMLQEWIGIAWYALHR